MTNNANIIIETISLGGSLKVSAIDTESGIEASIIASPKTSQHEREQLAIRKLEYVMKKKKKSPDTDNSEQDDLY